MQWLGGRGTSAEGEDLSRLLMDPSIADQDWEELMEELMLAEPPMADYSAEKWQPVLAELSRRTKNRERIQTIWWRRLAVAAVLLLIVGGAWFWLSRTKPSPSPIPAVAVKDLLPGGNRATLTLANGHQIVLDSAGNGVLATQGNARVEKGSGRVQYQPEKSGPIAPGSVAYNTLSTPKGGQYQLTLEDGTKVWLDAASSITYPTAFTGNERSVTVTGEAYFEVAHDKAKPFRVHVGTTVLQDLGTAFNVNAYADEPVMLTTLAEGALSVGSMILAPGEQASRDAAGRIHLIRHADVEQALAWKNGQFAFRDADLPTVMRQLSRWYDFDVRYKGPVPGGEFDGKIGKTLTLDQVLRVLTRTRVHYSIQPGRHLVISE